jgi:hypothetical protein
MSRASQEPPLNLPTGTARIRVGRPEGDIWPVFFQARTGGVAKLLDIREHLVSYWNTARMASLGSDLEAHEVGDLHADRARFNQDGPSVTVVEQRAGRAAKEEVLLVPEGTLDLAGAFFWLRFQPLAVGSRYELPVLSGTTQFLLIAQVLGEEEVKTPAGTFPCRKIGVRTAFHGKFSTRRDSFLWLSLDPGHALVGASADFAVGSVVAELVSYRPGGEVGAAE